MLRDLILQLDMPLTFLGILLWQSFFSQSSILPAFMPFGYAKSIKISERVKPLCCSQFARLLLQESVAAVGSHADS